MNVKLSGLTNKPSTSVSVILTMTLLSLLPAIVLTCTSFTKILVVLGLTRNALGLQQSPPNQVLAGLALFLSLFIMTPVLTAMNHDGLKPYMDGTKTSAQAWEDGSKPLKAFMLKNTDDEQLELLTNVAKRDLPKDRADVPFVHAGPGVRAQRAEAGLHHRLHRLHPVPGDRLRRLRGADGARHDDDAAGDGVAPLQAAPVRHGRRLGPAHQVTHRELRIGAPMTDTSIIELAMRTMMVALKLSAPILVTSLVIGFTVSLFQSMTQIQEFTLAFVPKLIGVGIALLICGNWMLHTLMTFTIDLFEGLPAMLG